MTNNRQPSDNFKILLVAASVAVFLLIVVGGVVRVTASGGGCPDWPTCFGSFTPPVERSAVRLSAHDKAGWDYAHRSLSFIVALLVGASAYQARRKYHHQAWVSYPIYAAAGTLSAQIALGALLAAQVQAGGDRMLSAVHLGLSLLVQAFTLVATAAAFYISAEKPTPQPNFKKP
ncbi:MAG TPA: COX15/CtaA family protein, partial [Anaerolineales bacterium]|nr:COX15/CtaA family protein [Anaerolineales bacterium]